MSLYLKWDYLFGIEEGDLEFVVLILIEKDDYEDFFDGVGLLLSEGVSRLFFLIYSNFRFFNFVLSLKCDYILDLYGSLFDINFWCNFGCFSECNFIGMFFCFICIRWMDLVFFFFLEVVFD